MTAPEKIPPLVLDARELPRIIFVLGKGGVGRSTLSAALGLSLAQRGEKVLVLQWAVADPIAPWFGLGAAGPTPVEVQPRLSVANFSLEDSLRRYFVDHLHLGLIYRRVVKAETVQRLIEIAPGLSEIFFLGELWWLTTLAPKEAGFVFDRIIVDAPATGHGASLLDVPSSLASMGASGLLALEVKRVADLMGDPARTGAIVLGLPEPLVMAETLELVPRVTQRLGRPPLALLVNRSATALASPEAHPKWIAALPVSAQTREAIVTLHEELRTRARLEGQLDASLLNRTAHGAASLPELLGLSPADVVRAMSRDVSHRLLGAA